MQMNLSFPSRIGAGMNLHTPLLAATLTDAFKLQR